MPDRRPVLLTVSGRIPTDLAELVATHRRPRADYVVMAEQFDADIIDVDGALAEGGRFAKTLHRLAGPGALLGWHCFRQRKQYDVIVTDGEQVGLVLALLSRFFGKGRAKHMMIVHILSTRSKRTLMRVGRLAGLIDAYVVYCSWQRSFIHTSFDVEKERVFLTTFMTDTRFFAPTERPPRRRPLICSAGLERRDYPTLLEAVDGLDIDVVIAAASPWSRQADSTEQRTLPANVAIKRLSLAELRDLYAAASFVVMPLEQVDFQAGITTILEAMSMGRPVLCSRTPGQTDTIIDGVTGRYVKPANAEHLRALILELIDQEAATDALGAAARQWVVDNADIKVYALRLGGIVKQLQQEHQ